MFYQFVENKQFNFQINRFLGKFYTDPKIKREIDSILPKLIDTDIWYESLRKLAEKSESEGEFELATACFQAGGFYLREDNENQIYMYNKFKENFYKSYNDLSLEHFKIPYENSFLPAVRVKFENSYKTLLIHGGYDSYLEELIPHLTHFKDLGYDVIAFEKRIKEVICFDIFYCGMDAIAMSNKSMKFELESLLDKNEKDKINEFISVKMEEDIDFNWKFSKGMDNTGTETPYDFLKAIQLHTLAGIEQMIDQDLLLLAGEEDQYVPIEAMSLLENNLVNAKSITKKIFTKKTGGEQHCQGGRMDLAFDEIKKFLKR
ncbi:alpha/beta hydrolase [Clostridium sp. SHJSY1]|uniref:alpha/beta hydrolase n=1 Tax=Clostridium sp. SHJSY1 TaxID=2942483 RepID=UPI002876B5FB|nr:alpha/beta hydrolase [Clostridium sp. SHJSY1]MDS0524332.1 alpha/beta hydrolase [Clostridium sp. SHJSY1]